MPAETAKRPFTMSEGAGIAHWFTDEGFRISLFPGKENEGLSIHVDYPKFGDGAKDAAKRIAIYLQESFKGHSFSEFASYTGVSTIWSPNHDNGEPQWSDERMKASYDEICASLEHRKHVRESLKFNMFPDTPPLPKNPKDMKPQFMRVSMEAFRKLGLHPVLLKKPEIVAKTLQELTTGRTLTQDQAKAISQALCLDITLPDDPSGQREGKYRYNSDSSILATAFQDLVAQNILPQAKADNVLSALQAALQPKIKERA